MLKLFSKISFVTTECQIKEKLIRIVNEKINLLSLFFIMRQYADSTKERITPCSKNLAQFLSS